MLVETVFFSKSLWIRHKTYEEAFRKVFYSRYKKDFVEWNKINCAKTGQFNFIMERLFNSLKERVKIMRGFKAGWSAKLVLDGYFIWYNFIRPHQTFNGATPAIIAKIEGDLRSYEATNFFK